MSSAPGRSLRTAGPVIPHSRTVTAAEPSVFYHPDPVCGCVLRGQQAPKPGLVDLPEITLNTIDHQHRDLLCKAFQKVRFLLD